MSRQLCGASENNDSESSWTCSFAPAPDTSGVGEFEDFLGHAAEKISRPTNTSSCGTWSRDMLDCIRNYGEVGGEDVGSRWKVEALCRARGNGEPTNARTRVRLVPHWIGKRRSNCE